MNLIFSNWRKSKLTTTWEFSKSFEGQIPYSLTKYYCIHTVVNLCYEFNSQIAHKWNESNNNISILNYTHNRNLRLRISEKKLYLDYIYFPLPPKIITQPSQPVPSLLPYSNFRFCLWNKVSKYNVCWIAYIILYLSNLYPTKFKSTIIFLFFDINVYQIYLYLFIYR